MKLSGDIKDNQVILEIAVEGTSGLVKMPAILDTGFNGELMLTQEAIASCGLELFGRESFVVASGDLIESNLYSAYIYWFGNRRQVEVLETKGNDSLLGMELLSGCKVTINVPGRNARVEWVA